MREQLIVTLTTWKARICNLPAVLDSIFSQTLAPDLVVVNLAFKEIVPEQVQAYLDEHKVEINRVPDTKVFKKLLPTLKKYPDACVVNIDDDWLYPPGMLEEFMRIHEKYPDNPISGNKVDSFGCSCHCGCASLTQRKFFGKYLDWIDEDVIRNCLSDDMVYTFFCKKNGYDYIRTENLFYENMTPYQQSEPYSTPDSLTPGMAWEYLCARFGDPTLTPMQAAMKWLFELARERSTYRKYLRLFGHKFYLEKRK